MEALVREASQWILVTSTLRPFGEIAKEAGLSHGTLKYRAKMFLEKGKIIKGGDAQDEKSTPDSTPVQGIKEQTNDTQSHND